MTANKSRTRRQHFLPRLLLSGFASRTAGGQVYAWYFRKGATPVETNVINIAAARDFHGRDGIEEKLADEEGAYAELLADLRTGRIPAGQESPVPAFVSHLIVRTKHLRDGIDAAMRIGVPALFDALLDPDNARVLRDAVLKGAEKELKHLSRGQRRRLKPEADRFVAQQLARLRAERAVRGDPAVSVADSQLKALAGPVSAIARTETLRKLAWSVLRTQDGGLILGDIGPIARGDGKPLLESPLQFNTSVPIAIYLPVSSDSLLVGQREPGPIDSIDDINAAMAELSREFFVARRNGDSEGCYQRLIGKRGDFLEPDEIRRMATEALRRDLAVPRE